MSNLLASRVRYLKPFLLPCGTNLLFVCGVASAQTSDPCALGFTFFAPGAEDDNTPDGWTQTTQIDNGNTASDQMEMIVLTGYPIPVVHVYPVHPLMTVGGSVPAQCLTGSRRKLQQAGAGTVGQIAQFTVSYSINGSLPVAVGSFPAPNNPVPKITLSQIPLLQDVSENFNFFCDYAVCLLKVPQARKTH